MTSCLYAIGDIHGHARLLASLLDEIRQHAGDDRWRVVFVGDYIDRGPDSAGVLSLAQALHADGRAVCLMGNHEKAMVDAASDPAAVERWMKLGGATALASFGTDTIAGVPTGVIEWLAGLPTYHEDALRYYVHAGVNPERPLQDQTDQERLSMRGRFLSEEHDFGKFIVHGHTPQANGQPDLRRYRVNLDTAVGHSGVLTAGIFDQIQGAPVGFLHARAS